MADSLQKTEQQRREFIANISHELKTPMTTIAGYADGILDGVISPEEERQYLSIISAESRRLSRLVRRMLDVSQLQSLDLIKQKTAFDLSESMRRVLVKFAGLVVPARVVDPGVEVAVRKAPGRGGHIPDGLGLPGAGRGRGDSRGSGDRAGGQRSAHPGGL